MSKDDLIKETNSLYKDIGWKAWFSRIRFWDAPYEEVEKLIPKRGTIVDLGCGEGIFTNFLGLSGRKRKIIGIDLDKKRIKEANRGVGNVTFKHGDATNLRIPNCDVIIMFHLLHHLSSYKNQEKLMSRCIDKLKQHGKLIIVEVDQKPFLKYLVSWFVDHFIVAWLFERKLYEKNIFFRDRKGWINLIKQSGLSPKITNASTGKPFSHIIIKTLKN